MLSWSHSLRSTTFPLFGFSPQQRPQFIPPFQRPIWQMQDFDEQPTFNPPPSPSPPLIFAPSPTPRATPRPTARPTRPAPAPAPSSPGQGLAQLSRICGREKAVTTPLIFHGAEVARGQLPWMVALFEREENGVTFFCGGTLISASTVLSAAHCFRYGSRIIPASRAAVSLGRNTLDLVSAGELREVSLLVIHEQYSPANFTDADIALLRLSSPVR